MLRAVAILALVVTVTTSQPPSPAPAKAAQDQQNRGQSEQTKTSGNEKNAEASTPSQDQSKAKVAIWNQTQPEKQSDSAASQQHPVEIWPEATAIAVAFATILLAALAVWQSYLMRKGLAETAKAANAATTAADTAKRALDVSERADVLVDAIDLIGGDYDRTRHSKIDSTSICRVTLKNYGSTRANNLTVECRLVVGYEPMPEIVVSAMPIILGPGKPFELRFQPFGSYGFGQDVVRDVRGGHSRLLINSKIEYSDVLGHHQSVGCVGSYDPTSGEFHLTHYEADEKRDS